MNRDESLQRPLALAPSAFVQEGRTALYPTEPGGGSWVAVNDAGVSLALINWYSPARRAARLFSVTRGLVVPSLIGAGGVEEVRAGLARMPVAEMVAFRLLAFSPRERDVREFRWDGEELEERAHTWELRHWFSSGYDEPRAQEERSRVAWEARREPDAGCLAWLRRLHASHAPARGAFCFCVHRNDAATVSYTEIVVARRTATMRYHDGPGCCARVSATTRRIFLRSARKESKPEPTNLHPDTRHEKLDLSIQPSRRPPLSGGLPHRRDHRFISDGCSRAHPSRL